MSFSLKSGKAETLAWVQANESSIRTIVDIGAGSGTYIRLIKEEAQCCVDATWIGVEIWKPYIEEFKLESRYTQILNQDIRTVDWTTLNPDVVIAGDVLEHMTKDDAVALVDRILAVARTLIVSIPIRYMPQDEHAYENPHEAHIKDDWSHDEVMETWGHYVFDSYRKSQKSKLGVYWLRKQ
jgi:cyclopropane fatty-acyl-phospholipid synthase-like methyltransferase